MARALIVNPAATGVTPARVGAVVSALEAGGPVETLVTERRGHATELARGCVGYEAVYVFAGDGGYNEVVNGVSGETPLGFIPGGATSVLPRALGLPRDPVAAARRIAAGTSSRRISLGRALWDAEPGGRRFTFSAGVGLDAELVRAVDGRGREGGKRPGDLAFVAELAGLLWHRRGHLDPGLEIEGHGRCVLAVATNADPYTYAGPFPVHASPRARFELGIDLVGLRALRPAGLARLAWWLLAHPVQERSPDIVLLHDLDRAVVRCDAPTPFQLDGEDMGDVTSVALESERAALRVLV